MTYAYELANRSGASVGDKIEIITTRGKYVGVLMPHHEFSAENVLTIKLDNGYNVGVAIDDQTKINVIQKRERPKRAEEEIKKLSDAYVALISTGGTIASYVDYRTGAVHPAITSSQLLEAMPDIAKICDIVAESLYSELSENLRVEHWKKIAQSVAAHLNNGAKGVIIAHGTDTMAYTAAALSFMLQGLSGPVVLVGAQRSSDRPSSDAALNLVSAAHVAAKSDLGEVVIVMHDNVSDDKCAIHRGVRVRKMHTSRRDAFQTINGDPLGYVNKKTLIFHHDYRKRSKSEVRAETDMEEKVALLYFYPGLDEAMLDYVLSSNKGVVLMGTGLGHVAEMHIPIIKRWIKDGTYVAMASQCINGAVNMNVYSTGRKLMRAGVIPCGDMLAEVAYIKMMWLLPRYEGNDVGKMMVTNLVGEISDRRELRAGRF